MKTLLIISMWIGSCLLAYSQQVIKYKISKPYAVFSFLEHAVNRQNTSITLHDYIADETKENLVFKALCSEFTKIDTDYSFRREQFPGGRRQQRSTYDLICIALVQSNSIDEFKNKIIGLLPNEDLLKLTTILKKAEPIYEELIWTKYQEKTYGQLARLDKYALKSNELFTKINNFYKGSWSPEMPFTVSLYPIPGKTGTTIATPHINSLCVGVLTDENDVFARFGVVIHEMCHVLYDEQSKDFQEQLELYFAQSVSPYKKMAHNFFDESLATAIGNGWAYKNLTGKKDTTEWYNHEYINGYAKVLFPMVEKYIDENREIDEEFVNTAIGLFASKFPNAISDYASLLNQVTIYSDVENNLSRDKLIEKVRKYFRLNSVNFSSPISDPNSINWLMNNPDTQLIIIDKNTKENIKNIKKVFPELLKTNILDNQILCFYDSKNRANILINAQSEAQVDTLLQFISNQKYFDLGKMVQN